MKKQCFTKVLYFKSLDTDKKIQRDFNDLYTSSYILLFKHEISQNSSVLKDYIVT